MSSRLRRMMGKRALKNTPTDPAEIDTAAPSETTMSSPKKKHEPVARDDLSDVPPPPAAKIKANADSARKVSPSKTLLDRYKNKSASSLTASPPTITIPKSSPYQDPGSPSPKGSTFKDGLETYTPPLTSVRSAGKDKGKAGVDAELPNPNVGLEVDQVRNNENVSPGQREEMKEVQSRRSTRSSTRRQERADSKQDDSFAAKDFADVKPSPADVPDALTIRKKGGSRTPSPASAAKSEAEPASSPPDPASPPPDAASPAAAEETPQANDTPDRPSTPSHTSTPPEIPPKSPRRDQFASILSKLSPRSASETKPEVPEFPKEKKESVISPVAVRPPIYDATKSAVCQWESSYGSSSRPIAPWMHSKRWTCCKCEAVTIVEQVVCSRMICKHDRCPSKCRSEIVDRMKGPFSKGV